MLISYLHLTQQTKDPTKKVSSPPWEALEMLKKHPCSLICILFFSNGVLLQSKIMWFFPFEVCYYVTSHIPYDSPPFVYLNHELPGEIGEICCICCCQSSIRTNHMVFKHFLGTWQKNNTIISILVHWWRNFHLPRAEATLIPTNPHRIGTMRCSMLVAAPLIPGMVRTVVANNETHRKHIWNIYINSTHINLALYND